MGWWGQEGEVREVADSLLTLVDRRRGVNERLGGFGGLTEESQASGSTRARLLFY